MLSVVVKQNLKPAGARGHKLSGVARAPALAEAYPHAVRIVGPVRVQPVPDLARRVVVEHFDRVARHDPGDRRASTTEKLQSGRVDEHGVRTAIVGPDAVGLLAEQDAVAYLGPGPLNGGVRRARVGQKA